MPISVVHVRDQGKEYGAHYIYCGRAARLRAGSPLGNPFYLISENQRSKVIDQYHQWLMDQINIVEDDKVIQELMRIANLSKISEVRLMCYCAPKACHCDVIKSVIEEMLEKEK